MGWFGGLVWFEVVWFGLVGWFAMIWCGLGSWFGWHGVVWCGVIPYRRPLQSFEHAQITFPILQYLAIASY